jgi:transcriptional regulator with XRE-family HTH domain
VSNEDLDSRFVEGDDRDSSPDAQVTINQIVAWNMAWLRKAAALTQAQLGERLGGWSVAAVSAAERSWDGRRVREFDANTLLALAEAFGVPIVALFLPPTGDGVETRYVWHAHEQDADCRDMADLAARLLPDSEEESHVMDAYRARLVAVSARYLEPDWDEDVRAWMSESTTAGIRRGRLRRIQWQREALLSAADDLGKIAEAIEGASSEPVSE